MQRFQRHAEQSIPSSLGKKKYTRLVPNSMFQLHHNTKAPWYLFAANKYIKIYPQPSLSSIFFGIKMVSVDNNNRLITSPIFKASWMPVFCHGLRHHAWLHHLRSTPLSTSWHNPPNPLNSQQISGVSHISVASFVLSFHHHHLPIHCNKLVVVMVHKNNVPTPKPIGTEQLFSHMGLKSPANATHLELKP